MKKTPLHALHTGLNAKMGVFAEYDMPLYYETGVLAEHEWVRSQAGLFDVSHMGQILVEGRQEDIVAFLETITPSPFAKLKDGQAKYTVLTNQTGGILDDLIVTRIGEGRFFIVVNAGCKEADIAWMMQHLRPGLRFAPLLAQALLALQGPKAEGVLRDVLGLDLSQLGYMRATETILKHGTPVIVSRLGYTGEDGFEISLPGSEAADLWQALTAHPDVRPIGLAARDSLRLEMGYPLYGHELDETTTPLEADLGWVMGGRTEGFIGAAGVAEPIARRRIGVKLTDKGVAREGTTLTNQDATVIGVMTSGGFSPSLKASIGMAYVSVEHAVPGTSVFAEVRGRRLAATLEKLPFIAPKTRKV